MKKTSIYIDPSVDVALSRRAAREGVAKAELIRQALEAAARESGRVKPRARGVFRGAPDLGEHDEEYLRREFGDT